MNDLVLPHRAPMRFVSDVSIDGETTHATAVVPADSPACRDGEVRPGYLIELAAQAAAAEAGSRAAGGRPKNGMLVGVRQWSFAGVLRAGERVSISLRTSAQLGPMRQMKAELSVGTTVIAHGEIQVSEQP